MLSSTEEPTKQVWILFSDDLFTLASNLQNHQHSHHELFWILDKMTDMDIMKAPVLLEATCCCCCQSREVSDVPHHSHYACWKRINDYSSWNIYHAFTRILTSPSWGSGIGFLVTLSLFRPPKPVRTTARISFESTTAQTGLSGSFWSIICSVSSAISVPSFAMSEDDVNSLTVCRSPPGDCALFAAPAAPSTSDVRIVNESFFRTVHPNRFAHL